MAKKRLFFDDDDTPVDVQNEPVDDGFEIWSEEIVDQVKSKVPLPDETTKSNDDAWLKTEEPINKWLYDREPIDFSALDDYSNEDGYTPNRKRFIVPD